MLERIGLGAGARRRRHLGLERSPQARPGDLRGRPAARRLHAAEALHVGDSDDDVDGARAAGIDVLRIDRAGGGDIASLAEIEEHLRR